MRTHRILLSAAAAALFCAGWGVSARAALIAEYRFDNNASQATFLHDDSGSGANLTTSDAPTQTSGGPFFATVGGSYADIASATDSMTSNPTGFKAANTHSVEMWIKPVQAAQDGGVHYFYQTSSAVVRLSVQPLAAPSTLQNINYILRKSDGTYTSTTVFTTDSNTGTRWYHIAYTYDAASDTFKIYRDGALKKTLNIELNSTGGTSFFMDGASGYRGGIDEIAVYNTVRTDAEILHDYQNSLVPEPGSSSLLLLSAGLMLGWRPRGN